MHRPIIPTDLHYIIHPHTYQLQRLLAYCFYAAGEVLGGLGVGQLVLHLLHNAVLSQLQVPRPRLNQLARVPELIALDVEVLYDGWACDGKKEEWSKL